MKTLAIFAAAVTVTIVTSIALCAPASKKQKGFQKNSDGSFVLKIERGKDETDAHYAERVAKEEAWMEQQDEHFRKIAADASDEENELMERICGHSWWDATIMKDCRIKQPWRCEVIVETLQNHEETRFYMQRRCNFAPGSFLDEKLEGNIFHKVLPEGATVEDFIAKHWTKPEEKCFKLELVPKKGDTPRNRLEVIKAWLKAMDEAQKAMDGKK
jgi:hypothetical protein